MNFAKHPPDTLTGRKRSVVSLGIYRIIAGWGEKPFPSFFIHGFKQHPSGSQLLRAPALAFCSPVLSSLPSYA